MNPLDVLMYGHRTLMRAIDEFPDGAWDEPGACGVWSGREIVAHLASYEQVLVEVLRSQLEGGPTPYLDQFSNPQGDFNAAQVAARAEHSLEVVRSEYEAAHAQTMEFARRIPAATFRQAGVLPWYGAQYDLEDFIVYAFYGHKREHSAQLMAFRDSFDPSEGSSRV